MAKKTIKPTMSMEEALWEACNKLRGSIEPSENKHVAQSLKFVDVHHGNRKNVSLWVLNANKKARTVAREGEEVHLRDREKEVLFIDLRQKGEPYEKKFVQLSPATIAETADLYHRWQQVGAGSSDFDIPGYCHGADFKEIEDSDYSLVPSKYIRFDAQDNKEDYATRMQQLQAELTEVMKEEAEGRERLLAPFDELGYKVELV